MRKWIPEDLKRGPQTFEINLRFGLKGVNIITNRRRNRTKGSQHEVKRTNSRLQDAGTPQRPISCRWRCRPFSIWTTRIDPKRNKKTMLKICVSIVLLILENVKMNSKSFPKWSPRLSKIDPRRKIKEKTENVTTNNAPACLLDFRCPRESKNESTTIQNRSALWKHMFVCILLDLGPFCDPRPRGRF
jgi:hypothetical protein